MSTSVSAPRGPAHSHTRVVPRPGSSTRRVTGVSDSPGTHRTLSLSRQAAWGRRPGPTRTTTVRIPAADRPEHHFRKLPAHFGTRTTRGTAWAEAVQAALTSDSTKVRNGTWTDPSAISLIYTGIWPFTALLALLLDTIARLGAERPWITPRPWLGTGTPLILPR